MLFASETRSVNSESVPRQESKAVALDLLDSIDKRLRIRNVSPK
jgi:hypothetical protein